MTRVLIVDDSAVARAVLSRLVEEAGAFHVVASVDGPTKALSLLETTAVDLILLDLEMPGIDGLTALPDLIAAGHGAPVLIVSSTCEEGAAATVKALAIGAADTLVKPGANVSTGEFRRLLGEKMSRLSEAVDPVVLPAGKSAAKGQFAAIAIGASTGGIHALSTLLREVPASCTTPIFITQHLPPAFSPYFAAQLGVVTARPCELASDLTRVRSGRIIIAPGDAHIEVVRHGTGDPVVRLLTRPVANNCLPSIDPMIASLAAIYGPALLSIILTGMGRDGLEGVRIARKHGGSVIIQDKKSSVVWGMPGAVAGAGLADAVMEPDEIGRFIATGGRP